MNLQYRSHISGKRLQFTCLDSRNDTSIHVSHWESAVSIIIRRDHLLHIIILTEHSLDHRCILRTKIWNLRWRSHYILGGMTKFVGNLNTLHEASIEQEEVHTTLFLNHLDHLVNIHLIPSHAFG